MSISGYALRKRANSRCSGGSRSISEHIDRLVQVCSRIRESGMKVKLSESKFAKNRIEVLGYVAVANELQSDPKKACCIAKASLPRTKKEHR